jgi:POT family proton-dependent oligopeptide transporter
MRRYPPGFLSLSASLACERFGFFLLTGLLLLYLRDRLGFSTGRATDILGCFVAGTFVSPLVAGTVAYARLGSVRTAAVGYVVAMVGYAFLCVTQEVTLYVGLTLVAVGTGAAKLAPQTLAMQLLADNAQRDRGVTLMYLLANVSAVLGPVGGELARAYLGWPAAFALAALSLSLAWLVLSAQTGILRRAEHAPISFGQTANPKNALGMLAALCTISVLFTVAHMQSSSTLLLWAKDETERSLFGWELPVPYVASIHAGLVLAVAPLLGRAVLRLKTAPGLPTTTAKVALGLFTTGLSFVPLALGALVTPSGSKAGPGWLFGSLVLLAVGELLVGALGASFVLRLAPAKHSGLWMGAWYGATAMGYWLAGQIGGLWDRTTHRLFFSALALLPMFGVALCVRLWLFAEHAKRNLD